MKKKICVLSGGMDSTTLLYDVVDQFKAKNIEAISFYYGSKHNEIEIKMAQATCNKLGVSHKILDLFHIFTNFKSALLLDGGDIPHGHYANENMKKTVVPFRNGIMLSLAIGYAESEDADIVYYGAHSGDHMIYPDCRNSFIEAMNLAAQQGTYNNISVLAPYKDLDKIKILKRGLDLKVDYDFTWTCYDPQRNEDGLVPCGKCGSCVERTEAFHLNGYMDTLHTERSWIEAINFMKQATNPKLP